jgi:hypothetical protein
MWRSNDRSPLMGRLSQPSCHISFNATLEVRCTTFDFNPIEMVFHPLKTFLRKAAERTIEGLQRCVRSYIRALDPSECMGYFTHAGYEPS